MDYHAAVKSSILEYPANSIKAWAYLKDYIDTCIETQPIRIHDSKNEGVFWSSSRPEQATCDSSKTIAEEGYSYAIFNSRSRIPWNQEIIGYEAYLLRQPAEFQKAVKVKCDLISYTPDPHALELTAIEVKMRSDNDMTNLKFASLQARGYGYILTRMHAIDMEALKSHIVHCLHTYCGIDTDGRIKAIRYAIAAPSSYFIDCIHNDPSLPSWLAGLEAPYFTLQNDGYYIIDGNVSSFTDADSTSKCTN